jgi:hypothetical protein
MLSGFGVYSIGRNHPQVAQVIRDVLDLDLPNMVQMDCAFLAGCWLKRSSNGVRRISKPSSSAIPAPKRSRHR